MFLLLCPSDRAEVHAIPPELPLGNRLDEPAAVYAPRAADRCGRAAELPRQLHPSQRPVAGAPARSH